MAKRIAAASNRLKQVTLNDSYAHSGHFLVLPEHFTQLAPYFPSVAM